MAKFNQNTGLCLHGLDVRGTLGHQPSTKTENIPSQVKALDNVKVVQAAIGGWHCLAVDDQGCAYAWGGNEYGQCGEELEKKFESDRILRRDIVIPHRGALKLSVRQVAAGGTHSVVLTREGHVWTWGQPWPPGDIKQISTPVRVQGLEKVKLIAVGVFHNLALLEDGSLWIPNYVENDEMIAQALQEELSKLALEENHVEDQQKESVVSQNWVSPSPRHLAFVNGSMGKVHGCDLIAMLMGSLKNGKEALAAGADLP
ncbi:hypothetical protein L2E82_02059 [Cichorium intybus]|uniref:Uncharacterized protein n=1 Tax=Cichorium intybus TaxID=13427 RepID=A0ACB9H2R8_CICIN|nr:hypothetical protein L2E82_02059 [Cichorium intybus]